MLQIKDVYEIMMKLPVIIGLTICYHKKKQTIEEIEILNHAVEKDLSLGEWYQLAKGLEKVITQDCLKKIYIESLELYEKKIGQKANFVYWRNVTIGHGALSYDNKKEFQEEMTTLLANMKAYLAKVSDCYKYIKIRQEMKGISFCIQDDKQIPFYPFMTVYKSGVYMFDSFLYGKEKYDVLCYPEGEKISYRKKDEIEQEIARLYARTSSSLGKIGLATRNEMDQESPEEKEYLLSYEENLLDSQRGNKRIQVDYLFDWLTNHCLAEERERGVFLLQMERGMGKTAWVRGFDTKRTSSGRVSKEFRIPSVTVKTVYINDSYNSRTKQILGAIENCMMLDDHNK